MRARSRQPVVIHMEHLIEPQPGDPEMDLVTRQKLLSCAATFAWVLEFGGDPEFARMGELLLARARHVIRAHRAVH